MAFLRVKNWDEFQQYKDRDPKWIKVHRDLLYDYEMDQLDEVAQIHLVKIWLLAAKIDNKIPNDANWIGRQIGAKSKVDIKQLCTKGFLVVYESVQPCTETYLEAEEEVEAEEETYKPEEKEQAAPKVPARKTQLKIEVLPNDWQAYCKDRRPELNPDTTFENFRDFYLSHGRAMQDWSRTWQRWVRNEHANTQHRTNQPAIRESRKERSDRINREALSEIAARHG